MSSSTRAMRRLLSRSTPHPALEFPAVGGLDHADRCALRFAESWLEHPLADFDAERARTVRARCYRTTAARTPLLARVYRAVRFAMLQGRTSSESVAQALSMHPRMLGRHLQSQGVTFQQIRDDVRLAVARELLCQSQLSLDDIAATLGYSGIASFMRAFRRWTGHTAGEQRRAAQCPLERLAELRG